MYRILKKEAVKSLENAIEALGWGISGNIKVEEPPNSDMGDIASSVSFQLAKQLKRSPMEITQEIMDKIEAPEIFSRVESKGPYINFFADYNKFAKLVLESVDDDYGRLESKNTKIILEHTSANPNGPLHIGHIRNSIIGDSLARILRKAGYEVETQYYVNDMGRQIAMIVWGLLNMDYQMDPKGKPDHEIGKLYFNVNEKLRANPELKSEINTILKRYEKGKEKELQELFKTVVEKCIEGIKITSKRLNIEHDAFTWESTFVKNGDVENILKTLEGCIKRNEVPYLDLNEYGIEKELILTRSDGTSLYATRDLAYHLYKSKNFDEIVDVLGSDHKLAVKQLSAVLGMLGGKTPYVIFYEFITLPEGSMSTRRGVFISVDDLMEEAVQRAMKEMETRRPDLNGDEKTLIAEKVGIGAIRYYIARLSPEKHVVFKWNEALSFERGCASIQYSHARACKLLEKAGYRVGDTAPRYEDIADWNLEDPFEIELVKTMSKFSTVIEESAKTRRVHNLAQYAQDLAGAFNKFYKSVPVIDSDKEALRLLLVDKARITIRNCLELMGIDAPVSM
ncbi:arginine--tRNA ligase [Methanobacterium paludis]|uniref:Arginine--tRNA ligase n=1 Tax=Methanobacterium paludis (strain DSM 25820 / JCM 18151 / SWAN1) TaxID=868131 RepID=F6D6Y4_METPW|nr:arginine--tRNA ligase [Methanobacterium paludis]AEG19439.1 Arginyl-tRNA synthetase [Methanobacterium paludis]